MISSKSNHLPSSPTSITRAPPSKDVGRVRKRSSTPLMDAGLASHCPHPPLCHVAQRRASRTPPLVCSRPPLCHVTWRWASRTPPPVCHRLHTLRFATSPDVDHRGRLPWFATALLSATSLDVERRGCLPRLPLPLHPPLCHFTRRRASRTPPVCHRPRLCHAAWHLVLRTLPPACLSKAPQCLVTHCKQFYCYFYTLTHLISILPSQGCCLLPLYPIVSNFIVIFFSF